MPRVMTGEDIGRAIRRISYEILESHHNADNVALIGIHTRGVHLARALAMTIDQISSYKVPLGELDIGLYRDDRELRSDIVPKTTHVPIDITGCHVVIVDDVLYTGRTVRSALDALLDHGRAATTELAVLVDRGHRQLPIRANYVGKNVPTAHDEVVRVRLQPVDREEGVWIERVGAEAPA